MKSTRTAFTLIELLVVIAIIGILMALLFPAVNGALDAARKAQAKNDVTQIATAVIAYETEYGKLPPATTGQAIDGTLISALTGLTTNDNPRKIVFLEVNLSKKGKSGVDSLTSPTKYLDPWGGSYIIAIDDDYDNTIPTAGKAPGPVASSLRKKVAVWNTNASSRKSVVSWE